MYRGAVRWTLCLALVGILVTVPAAAAVPPAAPTAAGPAPFDPYILKLIASEGQADFFVVLKLQADLSVAAGLQGKEAKGRYVFDALNEVAAKTQGPLVQALSAEGASYRSFWIRNMVKVRGDERLLRRLAARPDIAEIVYEYPAFPEQAATSTGTAPATAPETVEWNIERVNADEVWALGITGEGVVVGDLDTGVQWDHPALKKHYRGCQDAECTAADHNYNWWDTLGGSQVPIDYESHGTHTMGTIIGDDGGENQIGVAPGAAWIACPGVGGLATPTDCFQFFLAPTRLDGSDPRPELAPHVINNSWTSDTDYHDIIKVMYAAGIFYAKSGGNTGPQCGTTTNPGQWPEVTATAAFAQGDVIASFSSRGPVTIGHDQFLKPDIAGPGVAVRSSVPVDGYALNQGTSMACPHTTGAVALLISANPTLAGEIDILQMILKQTAQPVIDPQCPPYVDHPNDVWGWGIIDTLAGVTAAQGIVLGQIEGMVTDSSTGLAVADARIAFGDGDWTLLATSAPDGIYARSLPAATYDLTTTAYGYVPAADPGVPVPGGSTTQFDIALDPAPVWTVSGQVYETGTNVPLAATVTFEEPGIAVTTDPATGLYSAGVAEGTWWTRVTSPGHAFQERQITVDGDSTQDFALDAIYNYTMRSSHDMCDPLTFAWIDATIGGTAVCIADNNFSFKLLPSGRTFAFYGNTYSSVYIGSNGIVTFGGGSASYSGPIPDTRPPNNGIYAFSQDLNPANCAQGTVYVKYVDSRYYAIEYYQVQHAPNGNPETFEVILDLNTGQAIVQYLVVADPTEVVVGVENSTGTEATQYAYGDAELISDNTRVEFTSAFGTPPPQGPGRVEGVVSDEITGRPIAGATVTAEATGGGVFTFSTGSDGRYTALLCADIYTFSAEAEQYFPGEEVVLDVGVGSVTALDLVLFPYKHHRNFLPVVTRNY